jgi:ABC-type sugar transport system ATPase subunit
MGSGRTEVARAIFGADRLDAGLIELNGRRLRARSPRRSIEAGIGFVPEDRKKQGLHMELSQRVNMTLPHLRVLGRGILTSLRLEQRETRGLLEKLKVVPPETERSVGLLSGGNQQKVLFGKWLLRQPQLIILDEPTRGVDVGAKRSIYELITSLARDGVAVLLISSEMEEVLGLAHRVLVMRQGRIAAELDPEGLTLDVVMRAAFGVDSMNLEEVSSGT